MSSAITRLRNEVETIAQSPEANLTFAVASPAGELHAATTWFAPTDELDLLTFSAPTRIHAGYIEDCINANVPAKVAGALREDGQQKSDENQHGISFSGVAEKLCKPEEIEMAMARFLVYNTFGEAELDKYLNHPTSQIPPHGVYVLRPSLWTIFDKRLGDDNPERLVRLEWPPAE